MTREQAVETMTVALNTLDAVPTKNGWAKGLHKPSLNALIRIFGSYDDAVRACGFTPPAGLAAAKRSGGEPKGSAAGAAETPKVVPAIVSPVDEHPAVTPPAVTVTPPDPVPAAEAGSLPDQTVAEETGPPEPASDAPLPQNNPHAFAILDLLTLIQDFDSGDVYPLRRLDDDGTVEIAERERALVRRLARAALDQADPAAIGAAVLAQLDEAA